MTRDSVRFVDDQARLAALRSYAVLDSPVELIFDDITRIAAMICQTPIALISLVDAVRQWFKSAVGLQASETPIATSFCAHAIAAPGLMVIPDTLRDERFRNNPLVVGDPRIRYYAGAPLISTSGHALGTVCVIRRPRLLHKDQLDTLEALARQTVVSLELRRTLAELAHRREAHADVGLPTSFAAAHERSRDQPAGSKPFAKMRSSTHAGNCWPESKAALTPRFWMVCSIVSPVVASRRTWIGGSCGLPSSSTNAL